MNCHFAIASLAALVLSCASWQAMPQQRIAGDFGARLRGLRDWPLSVRCQAVLDAVERCKQAGLPPYCAWDGFSDRDDDPWTMYACFQRPECVEAGCDPSGKITVVGP